MRFLLQGWIFIILLFVPFTHPQESDTGGESIDFAVILRTVSSLITWDNFFVDLFNLFFGKRRAVCLIKGINNALNNDNVFRDDSEMILPEAGIYVGAQGIREYLSFVSTDSPYMKATIIKKIEVRVEGFRADQGDCEFTYHTIRAFSLEEAMVEQENVHFAALIQTKIYVDYRDVYTLQTHIFFARTFLEYFFSTIDTSTTRQFLCSTVLGGLGCTSSLGSAPDVNDCLNEMGDLPLATGNTYVDGNSLGCRLLHGAFASQNPSHCAHVSPNPSDLDPSGFPVCSASLNLRHSDYFDEQSMERFRQFGMVSGRLVKTTGRASRVFSLAGQRS